MQRNCVFWEVWTRADFFKAVPRKLIPKHALFFLVQTDLYIYVPATEVQPHLINTCCLKSNKNVINVPIG